MILKNLKKSKELKLKEFNSGKLTWDSKFNTKDWVRPVTLNIFMVKGFFCYPLPISMMSQRANQSFWYRTLPPTSPLSYRRDGPFICYLQNISPGEASDSACPKQSSSSFYPNLPFFLLTSASGATHDRHLGIILDSFFFLISHVQTPILLFLSPGSLSLEFTYFSVSPWP